LPPPRLRPEADQGEQRNPAAGFPRLLAQQVQNVQRTVTRPAPPLRIHGFVVTQPLSQPSGGVKNVSDARALSSPGCFHKWAL